MNNQEIFDTAINGLLAQEGYGYNADIGGCLYYDPVTGNRCAVGLLLPPETAHKWYEELGIGSVAYLHDANPETYAEALSNLAAVGISEDQIAFLDALQTLHDTLAAEGDDFDRDRLITQARRFAEDLELSMENIAQ